MAIRIIDIDIKTNRTWEEIKAFDNWSRIKTSNSGWYQIKQTTKNGQPVNIDIFAVENNWTGITSVFFNWQEIKNGFLNWSEVKNW